MITRFLLSLCWVSLTWAAADPPNAKDFDSWQKNRMELQSQFAVLQAKLTKDSAKIVDEDQREALAFSPHSHNSKKIFLPRRRNDSLIGIMKRFGQPKIGTRVSVSSKLPINWEQFWMTSTPPNFPRLRLFRNPILIQLRNFSMQSVMR